MKIIEPYLVDKPYPLIGAKTIQLNVMREILDYTVLRTEEDRQLNTVYTPLSVKEDKPRAGWRFGYQKLRVPPIGTTSENGREEEDYP